MNTIVDFTVEDDCNLNSLAVSDYSIWGQLEGKPTIIEITLPASKTCVTHYFNQGERNVFNSISLEINCLTDCEPEYLPLPDGVYTITIKGSPDSFQKTKRVLRTQKTKQKLDLAFVNTDFGCNENKQLLSQLLEVKLLLEAAKSNVRLDNDCKAQELLLKAQEQLEKLKGCNTCVAD